MPNARDTDGYNALPNGKDIYAYYVKHGQQPAERRMKYIKRVEEVARIRGEMEKVKEQVGYKGSLEEFWLM